MSRDASFTVIETDRLRLRRFELRDIAAFHAYRADDGVARYQSWQDYTLEQAERFVEELRREHPGVPGAPFQFAVARLGDDALVCDCMLAMDPGDPPTGEIGYTVAPAHQGRGYACEAAGALLAYAFDRFDMAAVRSVTDGRNAPSIAVARRLGMRLRNTAHTRFKGGPCEEQTYEVTREAWQAHGA
ncbi:GNAT family protein [soil metagenome]